LDLDAAGRQARRAATGGFREQDHDSAQAKKNEIKPWLVKRFCIPPEHSAAFVQAMEDVLEVYHLPYDVLRPVVCFDETSKQLVEHTRRPLPPTPGTAGRVDDEYKRCGTANIFLAVEPLTGLVLLNPTRRRGAVECAEFLRHLSDEVYPNVSAVLLVGDNLNTHTAACFYEAFPPDEARRLTKRFEIHHTPKHGSWMNIAEGQLSVLSRQCLSQRIGSFEELQRQLGAWARTRKTSAVRWHFTTADARIKLRRLYPINSIETEH
jgi:hypothetical protein